MNRLWLSFAFVAFVLFLQSAALEKMGSGSVLKSKLVLAFGAAATGCIAVRFFVAPATRLKLLLPIIVTLSIELILQVVSWAGLLPFINTKERLPWGRVYWTAEGFENSIRNRYGFHFPEFDLTATNRSAVIGDSFVEAVEVRRSRNMAAVVNDLVSARRRNSTVMAIGEHGTGPAHYLEMLQYAHRRFAVRDAIIVVYLGNDITDCSPTLGVQNPAQFLVYRIETNGVAVLDDNGHRLRKAYEERFESMHRNPILFAPRLMASHSMLVQVPKSAKWALDVRRRIREDASRVSAPHARIAQLGLRAEPFAVDQSKEAREAMAILQSLLASSHAFARSNGIALRLVTVPFFPPDFYDQKGPWTSRLGACDFLQPERELQNWARQHGVPILPLGGVMKQKGLTTAEIRSFYLSNGSGHFSEAGHRFAAESIEHAFFN